MDAIDIRLNLILLTTGGEKKSQFSQQMTIKFFRKTMTFIRGFIKPLHFSFK